MQNQNISESEKKMYEYVTNKYFKTLHIYVEVNVDAEKPRRTSIDNIKIFTDERKCIKYGKTREDFINDHNEEHYDYPTFQFYETVEFDNEKWNYKMYGNKYIE